jgi:ubiquinone/menaquinone biosynthesis C-methylase UbiE
MRSGLSVLDVGCGPGTDLGAFADAVGPGGTVLGVDHDPLMVTEARRRHAERGNVEVRVGDAHGLPVDDDSVDRAHCDRVVQHLADPPRAIGQLRRVVRPGGLIGLAEPDWDTLAIDDRDVATSRAFTRFLAEVKVRNGVIGRQLVRLLTEQGLVPRTVEGRAVAFHDYATADAVLGLRRNAHRAVSAGRLTAGAADAWLARLAGGPFLAAVVLFAVTGLVPGDGQVSGLSSGVPNSRSSAS